MSTMGPRGSLSSHVIQLFRNMLLPPRDVQGVHQQAESLDAGG